MPTGLYMVLALCSGGCFLRFFSCFSFGNKNELLSLLFEIRNCCGTLDVIVRIMALRSSNLLNLVRVVVEIV